MLSTVSLVVLTLVPQAGTESLPIGETVQAEIPEAGSVARTQALDALLSVSGEKPRHDEAPVRSRSYRLRVDADGAYTIELRSHLFDAYLVLRDASGQVIAEDDDGLLSTHARVATSLRAGRVYTVLACALPDGAGAYELLCRKGDEAALVGEQKSERGLDEARESVRVRERELGPSHPRTADGLGHLGDLLKAQGLFEDAEEAYRRALAINEDSFGPDHRRTASSLDDLGVALYERGRYTEQEALLRRALAIKTKVFGAEHPQVAATLNILAGARAGLGQFDDAHRLMRQALSINEKALGPDHRSTASTAHNLGVFDYARGRYVEAERRFRQALTARERVLGLDDAEVGRTLADLGNALRAQGRHGDAEPLVRRSLAMAEESLRPGHPTVGLRLWILGVLLRERGQYAEATTSLRRSLTITEQALGDDHPNAGAGATELARTLEKQGLYEEAEVLFRRAHAINEKAFSHEHPSVATSLNNLAVNLLYQGRLAEAEQLSRRAVETADKTLGPNHPFTVMIVSVQATLLDKLARYEEAEPLFRRALAVQERVLGAEHHDSAMTRNNLATCLAKLRRFEEAEQLLRRSLAIREESVGTYHLQVASLASNLGNLLCRQGRYEDAEPMLRRALAIHEDALGRDHRDTAASLTNLARLKIDLGEPKAAAALAHRALVGTGTHLRQLFRSGATEADRFRYAVMVDRSLELLLSVAVDDASDASGLRDAYRALLGWKGQVFRSVARARERLVESLSDDLQQKLGELQSLQARLLRAASGTSKQASEKQRKHIEDLVDRRGELEAELMRAVDTQHGETPLTVASVAAVLPPRSVLVDFHVHRPYHPARFQAGKVAQAGAWAPARVSAWILRPGTAAVAHVDLGPAASLKVAVKQFLGGTVSPTEVARGRRPREKRATPSTEPLWAGLWEPLRGHVGDAELVVVSPDTFLATLPFEALSDPEGRFLIETHTFVYVQDAASLARTREARSNEAPTLLAMGGVDYAERVSAPTLAAPDRFRGPAGGSWPALTQTGAEIDAIEERHRSTFGARAERAIFRDADATEEALKAALPKADVVHFATHGFFQPEGFESIAQTASEEAEKLEARGLEDGARTLTGSLPGLLSGLVCAGANLPTEDDREDGRLTAEEVAWLDLSNCDLVVLSACETGLGRAEGGEGLLSLRRAFRQAGASTVISSLWKVGDDATRDLMVDFYQRVWTQGESPSAALRGAQLAMLKRNRERHGAPMPSTWAAFVLSGDWR